MSGQLRGDKLKAAIRKGLWELHAGSISLFDALKPKRAIEISATLSQHLRDIFLLPLDT